MTSKTDYQTYSVILANAADMHWCTARIR